MAEKPCEDCGDLIEIKHLGKIKGKQLCKKCRSVIRKNHRQETINQSTKEEREKIKELSRKQGAEYREARKKKEKKNTVSAEEPKIKGSKQSRKKLESNSYLTIEDKRQLLRILMKKGLDFEEAKKRLGEILTEQTRVREVMREKNKSEEEIKIKQQEMLEELWNS